MRPAAQTPETATHTHTIVNMRERERGREESYLVLCLESLVSLLMHLVDMVSETVHGDGLQTISH